MRAYLEIVELKKDIITTSGDPVEEECCDFGCPTDLAEINGDY